MSPGFILACIGAYFLILLSIAWVTSRRADNFAYFLGNKASPWFAVAFGLIADSLSGVTFISVPGQVGGSHFSYFQVVLGYFLGYLIIARVLLPLYYRLNLTSIYGYLGTRFGPSAQKVGASFFLLSRLTGAGARLYLAAEILQAFVFEKWGIPFAATVAGIILLILVYTVRGGIRTLVWTDAFQSGCLVLGVIFAIVALGQALEIPAGQFFQVIQESALSQTFFWDWHDRRFFLKQILSGVFIAIVMTGLDQNSMQKNLSCKSLKAAQKNIYSFSVIMLLVNWLFLAVGLFLFHFADIRQMEMPGKTDLLFPTIALQHLGLLGGVAFLIGLTAATFSSADSVLTTLTTSFCVDFLGLDRPGSYSEAQQARMRHWTHASFAVALFLVILAFRLFNEQAVIQAVLKLATFTYGPLLGLFSFGLMTRRIPARHWVPWICILSPIATYGFEWLITTRTPYQVSFELLLVNGAFTFLGLWLASLGREHR